MDAIDLWTPRFPRERLHPHFIALSQSPHDRESLSRWAEEFQDVDHSIVQSFQTRFSPAFWELYLHAMFRSIGFRVSRPAARPDFIVDALHYKFGAEAKVTEAGPGQIPEWSDRDQVPFEHDPFYEQTTAKLSGALRTKIDAYRSYAHEPQVRGLPFMLCVSPYDHPWFVAQGFTAMTRVLFQYGDPIMQVDKSGRMVEVGHHRVSSFKTASGADVPLGLFLDSSNADISAVFFNPRATVSKLVADPHRAAVEGERVIAYWYMVSTGQLVPQDVHPSHYRETLADGGYLFLNPSTERPVDPEPLFNRGVTVCSFDVDRRILTSRTPEPFLKARLTLRVIPDNPTFQTDA